MKSYSTKAAPSTAVERQARKKKHILIALAAVTLLTWSRSVFGGDSEPGAKADPAASANTAATSAPGARPVTKSINSFENASERMKSWPAALERRVIEGAIPDLSPAYWVTGTNLTTDPNAANDSATAASTTQRPAAAAAAVNGNPDELPLRLRSTALLGSKRYAVIGNTRYSEGDHIQVPGVGELLIESVRSRETVLRKGQRTWTLTIPNAFVEEGS